MLGTHLQTKARPQRGRCSLGSLTFPLDLQKCQEIPTFKEGNPVSPVKPPDTVAELKSQSQTGCFAHPDFQASMRESERKASTSHLHQMEQIQKHTVVPSIRKLAKSQFLVRPSGCRTGMQAAKLLLPRHAPVNPVSPGPGPVFLMNDARPERPTKGQCAEQGPGDMKLKAKPN